VKSASLALSIAAQQNQGGEGGGGGAPDNAEISR
tara:strand:+ start:154 stop:255 length:102 start_codon:yes stop_codon:yes gene_type:complete